jgi:hypothetical protein
LCDSGVTFLCFFERQIPVKNYLMLAGVCNTTVTKPFYALHIAE